MQLGRRLVMVAAAALLGCSGGGSPSEPGDSGNSGPMVAVRNNFFDPATLDVPVNGTVTWAWNSGGVEHNVTFETGPSSGNRVRRAVDPRRHPRAEVAMPGLISSHDSRIGRE